MLWSKDLYNRAIQKHVTRLAWCGSSRTRTYKLIKDLIYSQASQPIAQCFRFFAPLTRFELVLSLCEQIGYKCASLLISVLLQILFISMHDANNIIQSLHGFESKSFATALPFKLKRLLSEKQDSNLQPLASKASKQPSLSSQLILKNFLWSSTSSLDWWSTTWFQKPRQLKLHFDCAQCDS